MLGIRPVRRAPRAKSIRIESQSMRALTLLAALFTVSVPLLAQVTVPPVGDPLRETRFYDAPCSGGHAASAPSFGASQPLVSTEDRDLLLEALDTRRSTSGWVGFAGGAGVGTGCSPADLALLTGSDFAEGIAGADFACLDQLWSFGPDSAQACSGANVVAIAEAMTVEAPSVSANAGRLERYAYYFQIAFFHEFYESSLTYDATTVEAAQTALVLLGGQPGLVGPTPPLDLLSQWCVSIDSVNASHLAVATVEAVLSRYLADPAREDDYQERLIAYRCLFTLSRQIGNHYQVEGDASPWFDLILPGLYAVVETIALDLTYTTDTEYMVNNALWVLNRFAYLNPTTRDAAHVSLTAAYQTHQVYSAPWLQAVQDLVQQFDGALAGGGALDIEAIQAEVRAIALPHLYSFDQGRLLFETAVELDTAEVMYDAIQEVEAQFFRQGGRLQAVPGDDNEVIRLVIYGSPSDYRTYQPFLHGLSTANGGIFIESWGTLFTYDRTPQQSIYTLEELLRHEFTHYLDSRYLVVGSFGESGTLYTGDRLVWYNEGLAEYMVGARRLGGIYARGVLFEQIASDSERLTVADIVSASYTGGFKFYRYAGCFFEFLEESYPETLLELFEVIRGNDLDALDALYASLADDPLLQADYDAFLDSGIAGLGTATYAEQVPTSAPDGVSVDNAAEVADELAIVLPSGGELFFWENRYRYQYPITVPLLGGPLSDAISSSSQELDSELQLLQAVSLQHGATVAWMGDWTIDGGEAQATVVFEGSYSATPSDIVPPSPPTGLMAESGPVESGIGGVDLSWTGVPDVDVGGYQLYRSTMSAGPYERVNTVPIWGTDYRDVTGGTGTAFYVVTAIDAIGNESGLSSEVVAESNSRILVVNGHFDSAAASDYQAYLSSLDALGVVYTAWDPIVDGPVTGALLSDYADGVVLWAVDYFNPSYPDQLGRERRSLLQEYLEADGSLVLSGAFVAAYLDETPLFEQFFFVEHEQWSMETPGLLGVAGSPVGDRLVLNLSTSVYASELTVSPPAEAALMFDPSSGAGTLIGGGVAVSTVDAGYRLAFLSFPFSDVTGSERTTLLGRLLDWTLPAAQCPNPFIRGDANASAAVDIADAIAILDFLFASGASPTPAEAGDASSDGSVDIGDAIFLLSYLFSGGASPAAPFPRAGCP